MVKENKVLLMKVDTLNNVADSLKKYVSTEKLSCCRGSMGIMSHVLPCFSCHLDLCVHFWVVFRHIVFADGFLFPVKELGLLNNSSY
jgi:hypothetical protein